MKDNTLPPYIQFLKEKTYPEFQDVMTEDLFEGLAVDVHNRGVMVRNVFRQYGMEPHIEVESYNNDKFRGLMCYIDYDVFTISVGFCINSSGGIEHLVYLEDDEDYEQSWKFPEWGNDRERAETFMSTMMFMVKDFINSRILPGNG